MVALGSEIDALADWYLKHPDSAITFAYFVRLNIADTVTEKPAYQRLLDRCCE
jgi:hypothetical protein